MPGTGLLAACVPGSVGGCALLRRRLGIEAGDVLVARADDDRLVLERRDAILARVRARLAVVPVDVSMVDELIAERREEAKREPRAG